MKKQFLLLLVLMLTSLGYSQTIPQNSRLKITKNAEDSTATRIVVQSATDELNYIYKDSLKAQLTPDLQSVINKGGYVESPSGYAWLNIGVSDPSTFFEIYNYNDDKTLEAGFNNYNVYQRVADNTANTLSSFEVVNDGTFKLTSKVGSNTTIINREDPIANTTLKFPAKSAGTYTLATTSDLSNFVDLSTNQNIYGEKNFMNGSYRTVVNGQSIQLLNEFYGHSSQLSTDGLFINRNGGKSISATENGLSIKTNTIVGSGNGIIKTDSLTANRTFQLPNVDGVLATINDIPVVETPTLADVFNHDNKDFVLHTLSNYFELYHNSTNGGGYYQNSFYTPIGAYGNAFANYGEVQGNEGAFWLASRLDIAGLSSPLAEVWVGQVDNTNEVNVKLSRSTTDGFKTEVNIDKPIDNTTIQFPAKSAGAYTLATTSDLSAYAPITSPTFTGNVTVPMATNEYDAVPQVQMDYNIKNIKPNIISDGFPYELTGSTTETVLQIYLIPGNTVRYNDVLDLELALIRNTSTSSNYVRVYTNTSGTTVGANLLATVNYSAGANAFSKFIRTFSMIDGYLYGIDNTASYINDISSSGSAAYTQTEFDESVDNYIIVTGQLANTSDSLKQILIKLTH